MLGKLVALFRRGDCDYEDEGNEKEERTPRPAASQPARRESNGDGDIERKRRHVIRHNCEAMVEMQVGVALGGTSQKDWSMNTIKAKARVLDLSMQGCAVFTKNGFDEGQKLRVLITVQEGVKIVGEGTVCWTRPIKDKNGYAAGVQFTKISPEDLKKVAKFLTELEKTLGL